MHGGISVGMEIEARERLWDNSPVGAESTSGDWTLRPREHRPRTYESPNMTQVSTAKLIDRRNSRG